VIDADIRASGRHDSTSQAPRFAGKEIEDLGSPGDFPDGFGKARAFVAGEKRTEFSFKGKDSAGSFSQDRLTLQEGRLGSGVSILGTFGAALSCAYEQEELPLFADGTITPDWQRSPKDNRPVAAALTLN